MSSTNLGSKGFDYSKWDHIELSDDEEDFHPNIDNDSMIRLKRRSREEREATEEVEQKKMEQERDKHKKLVDQLSKKMESLGADEDADLEKKSLTKQVKKAQAEADKITKELDKREKTKKWNVGNLCHVVEDRTIIVEDKKENTKAAAGPASALDYEKYVKSYQGLLKMFGKIRPFKESQDFLERHTDLLNEHATGFLLLWCLELEMDGKTDEMKEVARQQMLLQYVLDLAKSMHADPRSALRPFFSKIDTKGAGHVKGFQDDVDAFVVKLCARAIQKKKEMEAEEAEAAAGGGEGEAEEEYVELSKEERVKQAPGGLDPLEVFEALPDTMKEAFSEQDIPKLHKAIEKLDPADAQYHIDRCVKSGLWVPS